MQVAWYARFRTGRQIVDALQPYEFVRPVSVHYMTFNSKALTRLAVLARTMGVDLWRDGLRHGSSLKDTFDFSLPHIATRAHFWPWKQVRSRRPLTMKGFDDKNARNSRCVLTSLAPRAHRACGSRSCWPPSPSPPPPASPRASHPLITPGTHHSACARHMATLERICSLARVQVNSAFSFDRLGEIMGDVYSGMSPANSTQGPYALISLNNDFWTSTDFLARFQGNFLKLVRPPVCIIFLLFILAVLHWCAPGGLNCSTGAPLLCSNSCHTLAHLCSTWQRTFAECAVCRVLTVSCVFAYRQLRVCSPSLACSLTAPSPLCSTWPRTSSGCAPTASLRSAAFRKPSARTSPATR